MAKRKNPSWDDFTYGYFPTARPIKPADGIQSRSQRGSFASNWWAKRWLDVLEGYGIGSRLQRGRSYARGGQVLNVDVQVGQVKSRVQGSRPKPYNVEIQVALMRDTEWERALDAISDQAIFTAQLLDGTMPQDIESVFETTGIALFPRTTSDIETSCSCPDDANPCKHIAAVYYLLGEQFDLDPFLIFTLRGRTREQVIEALRQRRAAVFSDTNLETMVDLPTSGQPLSADMAHFWGKEEFDWISPDFAVQAVNATVFRRLGPPPGDTEKQLESLYRAMTTHVQFLLFGDEEAESDQSIHPHGHGV